VAVFLHTAIILSGVTEVWFDLRIMALHVALFLAWRVASDAGALRLFRRAGLRAVRNATLRPSPRDSLPALARLCDARLSTSIR
jgi:hypothetical protein